MLNIISIIFGLLGATFLGYLLMRLLQVDSYLKLQKFREKSPGVADLLDYAAVVDDGVIIGKSGTFMAAWLYKGPDNGSATDAEREQLSARINQALRGMGSGWMLHVDAVRAPAPSYIEPGRSHFGDTITANIDEERRRLFERMGTVYDGYFVMVVSWLPPSTQDRRIARLMFHDDAPKPNDKDATYNLISTFKGHVETMESKLSIGLKLTRLKGQFDVQEDGRKIIYDDFLRWLQFCVTGNDHPIVLPANPSYLDGIIGGQDLWAGTVPIIGGKYIRVVSINGFPLESTPGMLSALGEMQSDYRWSNRFIFIDQYRATALLRKYQKKWEQKIHGFLFQAFGIGNARPDQDAMAMVQDASDAMEESSTGIVAYGYYTGTVVLMNADRAALDADAKQFLKQIEALGFPARIEDVNAMQAWLGTLPGHGVPNVRRPLCHSLNFADMMPVSSIWAGRQHAPCPKYPAGSPELMHAYSIGSTTFRLNLHVGDIGHTLIFGPTGAGKSTLLALLAAQFRRYEGLQLYAFDKGNSLYPLTAAIRADTKGETGIHYEIGGDGSKLAFAPLQFLDTPADLAWASQWIEEALLLNGVLITPAQRNAINDSLRTMQQRGPDSRSMTDFCTDLQDNALREALESYTSGGSMGHLFDAKTDSLGFADFTVFETEELLDLGEKYVIPVLTYLFRRIEKRLDGRPSVIILDEAWIMFGHPVFREKIKTWLKVLRKANCAIIMATQSLSDAAKSGILDVMVESTATKIFLPNVYAQDEEIGAPLYRAMGMNSRQIQLIASAVPKRDYYLTSTEGRRMFQLALGKYALAFVGKSGKEEVAEIKLLESKYGYDWVGHWLRKYNINQVSA
jgi:type IV secretion system protein VirB4